MKQKEDIIVFKTISELMREMDFPGPRHPLVDIVNYDVDKINLDNAGRRFLINFYKISFKKNFKGQVKYGQGYYDFEEGGLAFLAPNQVVTMSGDATSYEGYTLYFHPDLIRSYSLGKQIDRFGFFDYAINEALFLSEREKRTIADLFESISAELDNNTDPFSQDVLVSQIELLLHHSSRFYSRQFLTRKAVHHDLISQMNQYLGNRFSGKSSVAGLPTVAELATHFAVSPRYLADLLKSLTGQTTQQLIHDKLMERAKLILSTTDLDVAEIAYQLGFEHPQSFNRLFKRNSSLSPNAFRHSFN